MKSNTGSLSSWALLEEAEQILVNAQLQTWKHNGSEGYIKTGTSVRRGEDSYKTQGLAEWPSKVKQDSTCLERLQGKEFWRPVGWWAISELTRQSKAEKGAASRAQEWRTLQTSPEHFGTHIVKENQRAEDIWLEGRVNYVAQSSLLCLSVLIREGISFLLTFTTNWGYEGPKPKAKR